MKSEQEIAEAIETALHRWRVALKLVKSGYAVMDCDRRDLSRRLMELEDLVATHEFSKSRVIAAAADRAHRAMLAAAPSPPSTDEEISQ